MDEIERNAWDVGSTVISELEYGSSDSNENCSKAAIWAEVAAEFAEDAYYSSMDAAEKADEAAEFAEKIYYRIQ